MDAECLLAIGPVQAATDSIALPDSSRLRQDIAAIRPELLNRSQKRFSKSPKSNRDRMLGSGSMPITAHLP